MILKQAEIEISCQKTSPNSKRAFDISGKLFFETNAQLFEIEVTIAGSNAAGKLSGRSFT